MSINRNLSKFAAKADSSGNIDAPVFTGDVTFDTSTLFVDATNNRVGIGTTSPGVDLVIYNGANWAGADLNGSLGGEIRLQKSGTTYGQIYAADSTGLVINAAGSGNVIYFQSNYGTKMTLDSNGNLGIGTASPAARLDVVGASAGSTVATFTSNETGSTTSLAVFQRSGGAVAAAVKYNASNSPLTIDFGTTTNHGLTFLTNNTERMRINSSGYVGIGQSNPSYPLHVNEQAVIQSSGYPALKFLDGASNVDAQIYYNASGGNDFNIDNYVSGSIVLRTNNVARMTIDSSGNVGIGGNPASKLHVRDGTNINVRIGSLGSLAGIFAINDAGSAYTWLRIDATDLLLNTYSGGNVGIGTSPSYKLDVNGAINGSADIISQGNNARFSLYRSTGINYFDWSSGQSLYFSTQTSAGGAGRSTRMVIDSGGNVGIGTSPSYKLDVAGTAAISGDVTLSGGTANGVAYLSGSKVLTTGSSLTFDGNSLGVATSAGNMALFNSTAANGGYLTIQRSGVSKGYIGSAAQLSGGSNDDFAIRAEANLVFSLIASEQMRLTSTGLGIGTIPARKLDVNGSGIVRGFLTLYGSGTNNALFLNNTAYEWATYVNASNNFVISDWNLAQTRLTIDTSGNVGINETSPSSYGKLVVTLAGGSGSNIAIQKDTGPSIAFRGASYANLGLIESNNSTGDMQFYTQSGASVSERMRITSGGFFKASNNGVYVGASAGYHEFSQNTVNANILELRNTSTSPYGFSLGFSGASPDNNSNYFAEFADSTTARCYIWSDGDIVNHDGSYGSISDERLKQDIVDAGSQWDDLKAIRFRKFRMKSDVEQDPNAPFMLGVVAQELASVSPGLVDEHPDYEEREVVDDDGNVSTERVQVGTTKTVKTSILLMKSAVALQEAMARIEQLEAEVAALKN